MKKAWMNISHFRFILFNLKIFGEIVTTCILLFIYSPQYSHALGSKKNSQNEQDEGLCCHCTQQDIAMYTVVRWQRNDHAVH